MTISNKMRVVFFKRLFFLGSVVIALIALALFLLDYTIYGIGLVGAFALWFLYFQVADYQYIEFTHQNRRITLRYYKAIRFGGTEYNSIEFPQEILYRAYFENSMFGRMTDLTLVVKSKRGIAEYPSVSLTALPKEDRKKMQSELLTVLGA